VSLIAGLPGPLREAEGRELVNFVAQQWAARGRPADMHKPEATSIEAGGGPAVGQGMGRAAPVRDSPGE